MRFYCGTVARAIMAGSLLALGASACSQACEGGSVYLGEPIGESAQGEGGQGGAVSASSSSNGLVPSASATNQASSVATGGSATCSDVKDCKEWPCDATACVQGFCAYAKRAYGTPATNQIAGDCRELVCYDALAEKIDNSDSDDGDDCTVDSCANGVATHLAVTAGAPCTKGASCVGGKCQ